MKLSKQDADLFYKLMRSLQLFVNKNLKLYPDIKTLDDLFKSSDEQKLKLNQAVYDNIKLIDTFIKENPDQLSEDELEIVSKWKKFIQGDFYIERFLKKYAIFISSSQQVYAVVSLYDRFDEIIHKSRLPLYVKTVLLPFKGRIIYDGLMQTYSVYFGGGFSRSLKEDYMVAKQNNRIIETLEPQEKQIKAIESKKFVKNWTNEMDEIASLAKKLRGSSEQPPLYGPVFLLIKASVEFGQAVVSDRYDLDELWKKYKKTVRALKTTETILHRSEK